MRQFVLVGHEVPTSANFSLDDLASGAGRLDLLCRATGAALFLSHGIREDVAVHLVCRDECTIHLEAAELRNARPDERTLAGLLRSALGERDRAIGHREVEASPGVAISKRGLAATLERVGADGPVVQLHDDGTPVVESGLAPAGGATGADAEATGDAADDVAFVLSDHREFTDDEAALITDAADHRVSLGPRAIHADHAVAVVHNYLDTAGYSAY